MKNGLVWRSFWNGPEGTGGPISRKWNVRSWPEAFLIDKEGILIARHIDNKPLDEQLAMVKELIKKDAIPSQ